MLLIGSSSSGLRADNPAHVGAESTSMSFVPQFLQSEAALAAAAMRAAVAPTRVAMVAMKSLVSCAILQLLR